MHFRAKYLNFFYLRPSGKYFYSSKFQIKMAENFLLELATCSLAVLYHPAFSFYATNCLCTEAEGEIKLRSEKLHRKRDEGIGEEIEGWRQKERTRHSHALFFPSTLPHYVYLHSCPQVHPPLTHPPPPPSS